MSEEKRQQLIESGQLRPDGSRIERCPVCAQELPEGQTAAELVGGGHAAATPGPVEVGTNGAAEQEATP